MKFCSHKVIQHGCESLILLAIFAGPQLVFAQMSSAQPAYGNTQNQPANCIPGAVTVQPAAPDVRFGAGTHLGPGDALDVQVFGLPELTQEARVNDHGNIDLPLIGSVAVSNLTIEEARKAIEKKLRDGGFVNEPFVTVTPKDLPSQLVTVLGEVNRPGQYPVSDSIGELIADASGVTVRAGHTLQIVHHGDPDHPVKVHFDFDLPTAKDAKTVVEAGDTVVVNKADMVYVVGEVARAAGIVIDNDTITVLQALSTAGGASATASLNKARILRRNGKKVEEIKVPLKPIMTAKAEDITMQPNDILFIPGSFSKSLYHGGISSIVAAAGLAAVVRQ
jgi:polysaccharide biosynthesis/export protein